MTKYYILEILQPQAFDVIMAIVFGMIMYFLLKWYICIKCEELRENIVEDIMTYIDDRQ